MVTQQNLQLATAQQHSFNLLPKIWLLVSLVSDTCWYLAPAKLYRIPGLARWARMARNASIIFLYMCISVFGACEGVADVVSRPIPDPGCTSGPRWYPIPGVACRDDHALITRLRIFYEYF
jgi:hypothetical protein